IRKITTSIALFTAMSWVQAPTMMAQPTANPFLQETKKAYGVPAFDKIKNEHFVPAFEEGMKQQNQVIAAILSTKAAPDFENTIAGLESSDAVLKKVSGVFYNLNSAHTNPEMQSIAEKLSPLLSAHSDDIYLNAALFAKVKSVYDQRSNLKLTA